MQKARDLAPLFGSDQSHIDPGIEIGWTTESLGKEAVLLAYSPAGDGWN